MELHIIWWKTGKRLFSRKNSIGLKLIQCVDLLEIYSLWLKILFGSSIMSDLICSRLSYMDVWVLDRFDLTLWLGLVRIIYKVLSRGSNVYESFLRTLLRDFVKFLEIWSLYNITSLNHISVCSLLFLLSFLTTKAQMHRKWLIKKITASKKGHGSSIKCY